MPTNSLTISNIKPKHLKLTLLLLLFPLFFFGQSLTGLWSGVMTNDSSTTRKDVSLEIALTEYRGKVYGYSCSEFIINDTLYYIVKRVKGTINGDVCEVKDDDIISYNFHGKRDKGVKVIHTFKMNKSDSTWSLLGGWKTNTTKKYYALSGKTDLKVEKDMANSKLFPHLEELNLAKDVAFYKEQKRQNESIVISKPVTNEETKNLSLNKPVVLPVKSSLTSVEESKNENQETSIVFAPRKTEQPVATIQNEVKQTNPAANNSIEIKKPSITEPGGPYVEKKEPPASIVQSESKKTEPITTTSKPEVKKIIPANNNAVEVKKDQPVVTTNNITLPKKDTPPVTTITTVQPEQKKIETPVSTIQAETKKTEPLANTISANKKADPVFASAATFATERKSEKTQTVFFKSDSLELVLYDNGEVDGDTVSVLMNGEVIVPKQCLKAVAYKKTIYIPHDATDSTVIVLYAENLGKYPPNTGLLIVHDGEDSYPVRFSADLQTNAAIILRRKQQ